MAFYSEFADYYDTVFPFDETTYGFLRDRFPSEASRILDLGCGTGDYCGRLASQGYEAVGIDPDPWMIERARRKYPSVDFYLRGMEDVGRLDGVFGAAICIGNVAAHMPRHHMGGFLQRLYERLSPWSIWILQTVNWDYVLEQETYRFPDISIEERHVVFERSYPEISAGRVVFRTRLLENGIEAFGGDVTLYPVRSADYIEEHVRAGFDLVSHKGTFAGEDFDPGKMSSSILVFRRP